MRRPLETLAGPALRHSTRMCADDRAAWPDDGAASPPRQPVASTRRHRCATRSCRAASEHHRAFLARHHDGHGMCRSRSRNTPAAITRPHPAGRRSAGTSVERAPAATLPVDAVQGGAPLRHRWLTHEPHIVQLGQPIGLHRHAACTCAPTIVQGAIHQPADSNHRSGICVQGTRPPRTAHRAQWSNASHRASTRNGRREHPIAPRARRAAPDFRPPRCRRSATVGE